MSEQEIFRNYGYILDLQGVRAGYFTSIRSQGLKIGTIDYREGGTPNVVRKLPGQTWVPADACDRPGQADPHAIYSPRPE